jgi:tetratricopeptide (TPR) repeat protein
VSGFVVCKKCGTRIKAGRGHCLRCFEPLPDPDLPVRPPLSVSLGLSRNQEMLLAGGTVILVALLATVIWRTWPVSADDQAQPAAVSGPAAAPTSSAPGSTPGAQSASSLETPSGEASRAAAAASDPALEATRADYEQRLTASPQDAALWNQLGDVLERMGRVDEAAARFDRAVGLAPREADYRLNLARAAQALSQWDRAIDQYREVVRLRPRDPRILGALGLSLQKKGDDQAAIVEFQRAHKLDPSSPLAALGLATSLEKLGRVDEAEQAFKDYLQITPTPADADRVRGRLALLARTRSQRSPQVK